MEKRILVWDLPTRIFHWTLALSFVIAYVTAESERLRDVHSISGYLMLALIGFRLIWGIIGSRYARFVSFVRGPLAVTRYVQSLLAEKAERHIGHNPAGALAIVALLLLGIGTGLTGWLLFNEIAGEAAEELHEGVANVMLAVVLLHIAGVIVASRLHRENLVGAMLTGHKTGPESAAIPRRHGIIAVILVAAVATFMWSLTQGYIPALYGAGAASALAPGQATAQANQRERRHKHEHGHDD